LLNKFFLLRNELEKQLINKSLEMSSIRHKSSCGQRSDSSESDRIEVRLESNPRFYECVKRFKSNEDLFISNYRPTGDKFVLRRTNLEQMDRLDFIANENRLTRLLKHKNLLPFLCSFVNNNELWTITPFAEFGSVSLLSKPTGMPEMAIAFVVRDVLSALEYLHRRGIVHRSIRGSHILVTAPNGRCLLSGLKYSTSVMIDGKWHTAIHQYPTNCLPNLNWLAPEVLEQNLLGYNSKSDIYSLGITLCELANGCVPFEDVELTEMLLDKLTANFPRPLDSTCDEINKIPTEG
jgi:STE20-related kinase adapter protein alpha